MEQQTDSKLEKEYIKAIYYHLAYLMYFKSTSYKMADESQVGIKMAGRNINYLKYADETTLMAESKEELKSQPMKVEKESAGLKLNIEKTKIMA